MKISTGIVRKVDPLGRVVIPREMRKILEIEEKDPIEISMEGSNIILHKYENKCTFCGAIKPEYDFKEKKVCKNCLEELRHEN